MQKGKKEFTIHITTVNFFKNFILDWGSSNLYLENHTMFPKKSTAGVQNGLKFKIDPAKAVM